MNLASNFQALDISYNNEFEIMTEDFTDTTEINRSLNGKK